MGLMRRLRRSFRAKAPSTARSFAAAASAASRSVSKSTPSTSAGAGAKPDLASPRPAAAEAKATETAASVSAANGGPVSGGGSSDGIVSGGAAGGGRDRSGGSCGETVEKGDNCASTTGIPVDVPTPTDSKPAIDANNVPAVESAASSTALKQLTDQISELRAELTNLRATVKILESRVNQGVKAGPRRLLRAQSHHPVTQSLVTSRLSLEEGPNCVLNDEEFHDALATSLLHLDKETDQRDELRKKKEEEQREELMRQKEQEASNDAEQMKEKTNENSPDEQKEKEGDGHTEDKEGTTRSDDKSPNAENTHDFKPSNNPQKIQDPKLLAALKLAPAKPSRTLLRTPSTDQDPVECIVASFSPSLQRAVRAAVTGTVAVAAPEPPLPPAAAPRGGCSGNCSQLGHPLAAEIERIVTQQLEIVSSDVSEGWTLFAEQGDMRMYKMEAPADNKSVDPLKAVSKARGVTARELCRSYWDPDVRLDWETTVDSVEVLARPDPSTVICHQLHRRIWPTKQRDTVFWSHLCRRKVGDKEWSITVNHSITDYPEEPSTSPDTIRAIMTSTLAGRDEEHVTGDRRHLNCHVAYSSHVNPGGWAPTTGLRLVYKREYPRFLQRFTAYATQKNRSRPVEV